MSFNLYFAGSQAKEVDEYIKQIGGARLFSFADKSNKALNDYIETAPNSNIFMDSGAFSVHHSGAVIDIDKYIEFINNTPRVTVWAQLDEIPFPVLNTSTAEKSSRVSWENYLYMMDRVKDEYRDKVIPIYHYGEPYETLERMLNTEVHGRIAPYIGIGGRHGVSKQAHYDYFKNIFHIVKNSKNPNVKIHAFGMTMLDMLEQYPFHSADSTTWLMLGVNGNIQTKTCGTVCVSDRQKHDKNSVFHFSDEIKEKIKAELAELNYTLEDVSTDYKKRLIFNVHYFKTWADNYEYKPRNTVKRKRLF